MVHHSRDGTIHPRRRSRQKASKLDVLLRTFIPNFGKISPVLGGKKQRGLLELRVDIVLSGCLMVKKRGFILIFTHFGRIIKVE